MAQRTAAGQAAEKGEGRRDWRRPVGVGLLLLVALAVVGGRWLQTRSREAAIREMLGEAPDGLPDDGAGRAGGPSAAPGPSAPRGGASGAGSGEWAAPPQPSPAPPPRGRAEPEPALPAAPPAVGGSGLPGAPGAARGGASPRMPAAIARMTQNLNLTPEQKAVVEDAVADATAKAQAIRNNKFLSGEQRREQMRQARNEAVQRVVGVLTPEQKEEIGRRRSGSGWRPEGRGGRGRRPATPPQSGPPPSAGQRP